MVPGMLPASGLKFLVVQPDVLTGPERFADALRKLGADIEIITGEEVSQISVQDFDGTIVMGGAMGDADTQKFPWLEDIRNLLRQTYDMGQPTLGICLGAQLMASALGGRVAVGSAGLEAGVVSVRKTQAAQQDPLLGDLPIEFDVAEMHFDAIEQLPDDAILLVRGETYPHQGFRIGNSWAVQFHPEISVSTYRIWLAEIPNAANQLQESVLASIARFEEADEHLQATCRALASNFVGIATNLKAHHSAVIGASEIS